MTYSQHKITSALVLLALFPLSFLTAMQKGKEVPIAVDENLETQALEEDTLIELALQSDEEMEEQLVADLDAEMFFETNNEDLFIASKNGRAFLPPAKLPACPKKESSTKGLPEPSAHAPKRMEEPCAPVIPEPCAAADKKEESCPAEDLAESSNKSENSCPPSLLFPACPATPKKSEASPASMGLPEPSAHALKRTEESCPPIPIPGSCSTDSNSQEVSPQACSTDVESGKETRVIIENTKGLYLVSSEKNLKNKEELESVSGLQIGPDLDIPGSLDSLRKQLTPLYLGRPLNLKIIKEIKKVIHNFYLQQGLPFTVVLVPKQCISTGVLQLIVSEARLGRIVMEGNDWAYHLNRVKRYIKTDPGETINATNIQRDIGFINRNPYRRASALYATGKEPGTTDIIIPVEERKPWRLYAGADNTGPVRIRRQRLFTGLAFNNVFGIDSFLNFQYTTAYYPRTFQGYTGQWVILLPWENVINFYGGFSTVQSDLPFPSTRNTGTFTQGSGRYSIPTMCTQRVPLEFTFGFDFKRTNTTLLFSEAAFPNSNSAANIAQFVFTMRSGYEGTYARLEAVTELYYSPGNLVPDQTTANYNALRPGTTPDYVYGKGALRYTQWLPFDFEAFIWLRGQLSSVPILPSEQYGIGGHDTVRGYDEYQLTFDNAANINFEFRTPAIGIISQIRKAKYKDALQFLGFVDYGIGKNKNLYAGEHNPSWLLGVGPGVRYTLDPIIALRLDWGWKMVLKPDSNTSNVTLPYTGGRSMVHFSATVSY